MTAETIAQTSCAPVPYRQLVFTIPKRLRVDCRHDRSLLGQLEMNQMTIPDFFLRRVVGLLFGLGV